MHRKFSLYVFLDVLNIFFRRYFLLELCHTRPKTNLHIITIWCKLIR